MAKMTYQAILNQSSKLPSICFKKPLGEYLDGILKACFENEHFLALVHGFGGEVDPRRPLQEQGVRYHLVGNALAQRYCDMIVTIGCGEEELGIFTVFDAAKINNPWCHFEALDEYGPSSVGILTIG